MGGVGAVIGGLSGKKASRDIVRSVEIRIGLLDPKAPLHVISLLSTGQTKRSGIIYQTVSRTAQEWHARIKAVIERAEREATAAAQQAPSQAGASLAEEIRKLSELRDAGVLSAEEFAGAKAKLLSAS